jgi:hypothetical protein
LADPITLGVAGAGLGAMTSDDPLKGAMLGGLGGWAGGSMMGLGAAGGAGAANTAMYGALPGLSATGAGSQAAMLAAQTAEFGTPGLLATGEALAAPGSMQAGLFGAGNNMFGGSKATDLMKMGAKMQGGEEQQQQRPMIAAPQMPQGQNATIRPYTPGSGNPSEFMPYEPEMMAGFNMRSPFRR